MALGAISRYRAEMQQKMHAEAGGGDVVMRTPVDQAIEAEQIADPRVAMELRHAAVREKREQRKTAREASSSSSSSEQRREAISQGGGGVRGRVVAGTMTSAGGGLQGGGARRSGTTARGDEGGIVEASSSSSMGRMSGVDSFPSRSTSTEEQYEISANGVLPAVSSDHMVSSCLDDPLGEQQRGNRAFPSSFAEADSSSSALAAEAELRERELLEAREKLRHETAEYQEVLRNQGRGETAVSQTKALEEEAEKVRAKRTTLEMQRRRQQQLEACARLVQTVRRGVMSK